MAGGRPSGYNDVIADLICMRLAQGETLIAICKEPDMPSQPCIYEWISKHPEFAKKYARAREQQAEFYAEEINTIANSPCMGLITKRDGEGNIIETTEADMIQHRRLQVDARKWFASKVYPKKFGEKLGIGQADGLDPVEVTEVVRRIVHSDDKDS